MVANTASKKLASKSPPKAGAASKPIAAKAGKKPTRAYLKGPEREMHILRRAVELFIQKGFSVSTREIAAHCGVTQSLLYRYFPSKQIMLDRLYREIYVGRVRPEWEQMVCDRTKPIEVRLNEYLRDYLGVILQSDWVRLFMFGALEDPRTSRPYLAMLSEGIHIPILNEIRHEVGLPPANEEEQAIQLEVVWGFHSSFFYLGVRRWIYRMTVPDDLDAVVAIRTRAFLAGMKEILLNRPDGTIAALSS